MAPCPPARTSRRARFRRRSCRRHPCRWRPARAWNRAGAARRTSWFSSQGLSAGGGRKRAPARVRFLTIAVTRKIARRIEGINRDRAGFSRLVGGERDLAPAAARLNQSNRIRHRVRQKQGKFSAFFLEHPYRTVAGGAAILRRNGADENLMSAASGQRNPRETQLADARAVPIGVGVGGERC